MRFIILFLFPFSLSSQEIVDSLVVKHELSIFFESNQFDLGEDQISSIKNLIDQAAGISAVKYFVDAHTDDVGSFEYNLKLSEKRKESVLTILKNQQVSDAMIISNYHGESSPAISNIDEASRQRNRRVVLQLLVTIPFVEIQGLVQDEETGEGIFTEVHLSSKEFSTITNSNRDGAFSALVPLGKNILIEATAKGYFISSKVINSNKNMIGELIRLPLPKAYLGRTFEFKDMLFVGNSPQLLTKSFPSLNKLQRFMFVNTESCIEIAGHVNQPWAPPVNKGSFEMNLSIARANAIQDSLVSKGINPDRMLSRGYGNRKMIFPKANNDKERERNRRVEIIMSSCDSTAIISDDTFNSKLSNGNPELDKYYDPKNVEEDLSQLKINVRRDILAQLKKMNKEGLNATKYTYKELLLAFPDLPKSN